MESQWGDGGSVDLDDTPLEAMTPEPLLTRDYETRPSLRVRAAAATHTARSRRSICWAYPPGWSSATASRSQVLQDDDGWPKGLENWRARSEGRVPADWPLGPSLEVNHVLIQGGPGYRQLRTAWDVALQPFQDPRHPQAKRLKTAVTAYADELITLVGQAGRTGVADLSAQFSRPLPLMVASHLLGFPGSQGDDALMDMWRVLDAGPDAEPALERLLATLAELAAMKLKKPGDDFPSYLLAAHPDLSLDELARELFMLLGMTSDHVGILISNTVVEVLSGDGGVRASLSAGMVRETMNRVVMRKPPLVNFVPRFATQDTPLGNYTIRAGDPVWVSPRRRARRPALRRPRRVESTTVSTRAHLSWGAGRRQCPARELASTVAAVGVSRLFERFAHLDLALPVDQLPLALLARSCEACARCPSGTNSPRCPSSRAADDPAQRNRPRRSLPDPSARQRSSLWRYLTGLIRGGR